MRILIVTRRYPPFVGGVQQQLARLAQALARRGHEVTVLTGRHLPALPPVRNEEGVRVYRLFDPPIRVLGTVLFLIGLAARMLTLRNRFQITLVSMMNETSALSIRIAHLLGKPVVLRVSAVGNIGNVAWARSHIFGRLYLSAARSAEALIIQAKHFAASLLAADFTSGQIHLISNPAPDRPPSSTCADTGTTRNFSQAIRILWCGRLSREKDPEILTEVAGILRQREVEFHIDVVGDGELHRPLQRKITDSALAEYITLHGFKEDPAPYFRDADILLLTSTYDASPNVILEAMVAGVPVVATNVGGVPEMVQDGVTGILTPPNDPGAIAHAIEKLVEDPVRRRALAHRAKDYVRQNHDPNRIAALYESLFETLVRG